MSHTGAPLSAQGGLGFLYRSLKSKLLQQSGFYLLGQSLQKAVSLLLIPVWTAYLTPSDYGITGTLAAYSTVLHILLMFGIYGAVVRHFFDYQDDLASQRSYVSSNFVFLAVVAGVVLGGLALFGQPLWSLISSQAIPFQPYVILMLISAYAGLIYRLPYSLFQAQQKARKCVTLDFGAFLMSVGLSLLFVVGYRQGAYGMMLGGGIAQVVMALIATGLLLKEWFVPQFHWRHIAASLRFGLPIVPHLLSGWALNFVDRVMLEKMVSLDEVGRYTLGYNLGMVMSMIVMSINEAYQPYYFKLMKSGADPETKIYRIVSLYLAGIGFLALAGSLFSGEIISLITPLKYHSSARYIPPILIGYLMVGIYFFVASPIFFYKKTVYLPIITGIAAILNIALNLLLIPRYGPIAAAWNTFACYAVMAVLYYLLAQKLSPFRYPLWRGLAILLFILAATIFAPSLPLFVFSTWAVKLLLCLAYAALAYILLLKPLSLFGGGAHTEAT